MSTKKHRFPEFTAGSAVDAYSYLGAHPEKKGWTFRVWAPAAKAVSLVGDFNGWNDKANTMFPLGDGIWEVHVDGLEQYDIYKYAITGSDGQVRFKADPYAFHAETRPGTASKLYDLAGYKWGDAAWLKRRAATPIYDAPANIYEIHLGSWRRTQDGEFLSYRDMAEQLPGYVKEMGFTHVELMPITEYPLDASWGYQCTGYFAATSRYGTPHDLMYLIDKLHQAGVGVILDWVPAHFPRDAFGLYQFDGSPTYEYADSRKGEHKDWGTMVFDYARHEVRSFLFSSANFWMQEYHIDGLRVDAVASMLYLDYSRRAGEWMPNINGGHENLEAVDFLQKLNQHMFSLHPGCLMIAEESTAWPNVSKPVGKGGLEGGLGFNLKWNMGWMNDITHYMKLDPYFRQFNHKDITFSFMYAFSENFVLPLSHDEVVHMKGSFLNKMPGKYEEQFQGVRAFYGYMMTHPGKKLTMMGSEFGQWNEWHFESSLDWHLIDPATPNCLQHRQLHAYFKALNDFYLKTPALWEQDFSWEGFEWLCADDNQNNVASFIRRDKKGKWVMVVCNFSPVLRQDYRVGVPEAGQYEVLFSSDDAAFGGEDRAPKGKLKTAKEPMHGREQSLSLTIPPMSTMILACTKKETPKKPAAKKAAKPAAVKPVEKKAEPVKAPLKAVAKPTVKKLGPVKADVKPAEKKPEPVRVPLKVVVKPAAKKPEPVKAPAPVKAPEKVIEKPVPTAAPVAAKKDVKKDVKKP